MISSFTLGVAVAVKAKKGNFGKCVLSWKFSNKLAENHVPIAITQWASSMVIKFMGRFFILSIIQSDCKRSGDK
jgi:hypothetical protein